MNQPLMTHWANLLTDTDSLLDRLHSAYGCWDRVEDYLTGAVASRGAVQPDPDDLYPAADDDFEPELLAAELAWKGRCDD